MKERQNTKDRYAVAVKKDGTSRIGSAYAMYFAPDVAFPGSGIFSRSSVLLITYSQTHIYLTTIVTAIITRMQLKRYIIILYADPLPSTLAASIQVTVLRQ